MSAIAIRDNAAHATAEKATKIIDALTAERDELKRTVQAQRVQIALLDDYAETIRQHEITIEAQAAQLEQARELRKLAEELVNALGYYMNANQEPQGVLDAELRLGEWLAANATQDVKA